MMDGGRMIHGVERTHPGYVVGKLPKGFGYYFWIYFHKIRSLSRVSKLLIIFMLLSVLYSLNNEPKIGAFNRIEYQGNDTWYMMSDEKLIDVYQTSDFRITFVWRGLCFRDEAERFKFEKQLENEDFLDNEYILTRLEQDLRKRGKLSKNDSRAKMGPKKFGKLLQKVYMQYPLDSPDAWFKVNYCAIGYQKPWLEWLMSPFCIDTPERPDKKDDFPPARRFCDPENRQRRHTNCPEGFQGEI